MQQKCGATPLTHSRTLSRIYASRIHSSTSALPLFRKLILLCYLAPMIPSSRAFCSPCLSHSQALVPQNLHASTLLSPRTVLLFHDWRLSQSRYRMSPFSVDRVFLGIFNIVVLYFRDFTLFCYHTPTFLLSGFI